MAKNGFRVMDSDMHIVEPADLWERYIDPAFRDRAPKGMNRHPRDLGVRVGENVYPLPNRSYSNAIQPLMTSQQDVYADSEQRDWDSASQVTAMDNEGIDVAVLFPSRGLFTLGDSDLEPAFATAISKRLQRLAGRLLQRRSGAAVRRGYDSAARHRGCGGRGPAGSERVGFQDCLR